MRQIPISRDVSRDTQQSLQETNSILKEVQIPLLKSMLSVRGIQEGTAAYFLEKECLYRYTKIRGKLYKEKVAVEETPQTAPEIQYSSEFRET